MTTTQAPVPWLSIVGIGEDGIDGLSPAARRLIAQAGLVVGGKRHLALAGDFSGARMVWPSPPDAAFPDILARRGSPVCVLATGDPFFFGIGSVLVRCVDPNEMICLPAPCAFSLAAARMGWAIQDCALVSLHGRGLERIVPHLQPGARILALSWDGGTPAKVAGLLSDRGLHGSPMTVFEAMGGPRERVRRATASTFDIAEVDPLNTIALEVVAGQPVCLAPRASGLPDELFEHDGQITKREVRAITLSTLAPRHGELLWDIGSGCGSIAIEWLLCHPSNRAVAIEARHDRAARIVRNSAVLGVPNLDVVEGTAPEVLAELSAPDAVFIGGGVSRAGVLDAALEALRPGGRLVANAVTIEGQTELMRRQTLLGGELVSIQISRVDRVGSLQGWRPAMPVVQWSVVK